MTARSAPEQADIAIAGAAAEVRDAPLVRALGRASEVADQPQMISFCAAALAVGLLAGHRRLALAGGRMLAAELVATQLKALVKNRVDRTRPSVLADGGSYQAKPGDDDAHEMNSFPSGHTAGAVAVARAFARSYPEHRAAAYGAATAIAAIQVPRCAHYPTDVGAGALIGVIADLVVEAGEKTARTWAD